MSATSNGDPIEHIVVLMLENHSFDQMLGCFKEVYPDLEGVGRAHLHSNVDPHGKRFTQAPTTERQMLLDPHHEVDHVADQLKNDNGGFVADFARSFPKATDQDKQFIMGYYPLDFLPALHALARDFTICDHWYSSLPGPTWPNRFFALTGTSSGQVNMPHDGKHGLDISGYFQQDQDTIFDRLSEKGIHWKCYFHDFPQSWVLRHQREPHNAARYFYINRFHEDTRGLAEDFPQFCFIEPHFLGFDENDDHPPHDIMKGEKLIADVYNSLRSNPDLWSSTLLVVYFDEHGGYFDHVVPPKATPPGGDAKKQEYRFDQFGLRVPALLVSPWVKKGVEGREFDHTSLLKYLLEKWSLGPLGNRTAKARSIGVAVGGANPYRRDTIERIELTHEQLMPPDSQRAETAAEAETLHQQDLAVAIQYLKHEANLLPPGIWSSISRLIEWLKVKCLRMLGRGGGNISLIVSPTQPDHISGKQGRQAKLHREFTRSFGRIKRKSISALGKVIRDATATDTQREHAVRALAEMTGRKFHRRSDKINKAEAWLRQHGH